MNQSTIIWEAHAIMQEVKTKFPEHASVIDGLRVRLSNRMTRGMGSCRYKGGVAFEITLSFKTFQHDANRPELRDTILHEIAHAIAGIKAGHGPVWRAVARKIGAKPQRVCTTLAVSAIQYVEVACYVCSGPLKVTKNRATRVRNGTRRYRHNMCKSAVAPRSLFDFNKPFCI